jgi:hypothetical protein
MLHEKVQVFGKARLRGNFTLRLYPELPYPEPELSFLFNGICNRGSDLVSCSNTDVKSTSQVASSEGVFDTYQVRKGCAFSLSAPSQV